MVYRRGQARFLQRYSSQEKREIKRKDKEQVLCQRHYRIVVAQQHDHSTER
jgi:hypothetical protein